jgi:ElaB/YqjD/DUF883 family membrane-anchored ribosome-binding protein
MAHSRDTRTGDVRSDAWSDTWTELLGLKDEIAEFVSAKSDRLHAASHAQTEAFAEQMKDILHEVGETLKQDEQRLEDLVIERPLPALAIAFAVGLVVGVSLRALR